MIPEAVLKAASTYQTPAGATPGKLSFDVLEYLKVRSVEVARTKPWNSHPGGVIHELARCIFNPDHVDGSASVMVGPTGVPGYSCKHNGCQGRAWEDVRAHFDGPKRPRANTGPASAPPETPWPETEHEPDHQKRPDQSSKPAPPRLVSGEEILEMSLPKTDFAIEPIVSRPGLWLVNGSQKAGKTILAAQIALSLQAPEALMGWYAVPRACGALFIEQDDPAGLAALQPILQRTRIPLRKERFFSVEKAKFSIGPEFIDFLERQIAEHDLGVIVLDSYTAMRGPRKSGCDIVKAESLELGLLDALAKRTGCLILVIHHSSKGSASLDWSDKAAGTYAMGAHSEGQIFVSRFADLPSNAPERLVQIRGRHVEGTELVIRFDVETLSYTFVLEGCAAALYPVINQIKAAFGTETFSPKSMFQELGIPQATAHRAIGKLIAGGAVRKTGYGEYTLAGAF